MLTFQSSDLLDRPASYLAFDSEWTKNYKIKGGNHPFCFSATVLPRVRQIDESIRFSYAYAYVDNKDEGRSLVAAAERLLRSLLGVGHTFVGHQLSSDLAALINFTKRTPKPALHFLRSAWWLRRDQSIRPRVVDTRYDLDELLTRKSRRLVDVCIEMGLDVTQPELGASSMTALQKIFLNSGDERIRERLLVMNIRHGVSCGLLALMGDGVPMADDTVNVNRILDRNLKGRFSYLRSSAFQSLL